MAKGALCIAVIAILAGCTSAPRAKPQAAAKATPTFVDPPKDVPVRDTDDRHHGDYPVSRSTHKMVLDTRKHTTVGGSGLRLSGVIDENGNVTQMRILSLAFPTAPNTVALNEQAIESVKRWHYRPTILDGKPVSVYTEIVVTIDLQ